MGKGDKSGVGVFLVGGFLLFALGLFMIGDRRQMFTESIDAYADFADLAGLQNGATVRVSGMDAGEVTSIEAPPTPEGKFRVRFRIIEKLQPIVREDSVASIQTDGIVGNMFLQVEAGTSGAPQIENGRGVKSVEPFQISDFLDQAKQIVETADELLDEVKQDLVTIVRNVNDVAEEAETLVAEARPNITSMTASAKNIADDVEGVMNDINAGKGTVGKLFKDEKVYEDLKSTTETLKKVSEDVSKISSSAGEIIDDAKQKDVVGKVDQTVANVRDLTAKANDLLDKFQKEGDDGEPSMTDDVRQTMASARETMTDFAEDAEALKHNFLLRGFFKKRGFYDLNEISPAEYKAGERAPGYPLDRVWLHSQSLFDPSTDLIKLTDEGKRAIDRAFGEFIDHVKDDPVMVEGYAGVDNPSEAYLLSQRRAAAVRGYLINKYGLRPNYVGVMEMGRVESTAKDGKPWDGVALVRFLDKKEKKALDKEQKK
ncbi:MAG: MCE family protein [Acidobacteria bacterium]|nr:MCE family protein [Acidobacteriota bacterium]